VTSLGAWATLSLLPTSMRGPDTDDTPVTVATGFVIAVLTGFVLGFAPLSDELLCWASRRWIIRTSAIFFRNFTYGNLFLKLLDNYNFGYKSWLWHKTGSYHCWHHLVGWWQEGYLAVIKTRATKHDLRRSPRVSLSVGFARCVPCFFLSLRE